MPRLIKYVAHVVCMRTSQSADQRVKFNLPYLCEFYSFTIFNAHVVKCQRNEICTYSYFIETSDPFEK